MEAYSYVEKLRPLRESVVTGKTKSHAFRLQQLHNLRRMYEENTEEFIQALQLDLRKPRNEAVVFEVDFCLNDVRSMIYNFQDWAKPTAVSRTTSTLLDTPCIYSEPYGLVLIIGAWNFPMMLSLVPVSGAIAAGNCVVLKPSEVASASSSLMAKLFPRYLDPTCYVVIEGGVEETTQLLRERFDYIFYTGGSRVGRIVREASNRFLTPVTLELGGKSPLYLDGNVDWDTAVRRILWGKFCCNLGQACIAPDYILCNEAAQEEFIKRAAPILRDWFGSEPQKSNALARLINDRQFSRLQCLLQSTKGRIRVGGSMDFSDRFIEPTIISDVSLEDPLMTEEIFGPLLPVVRVQGEDEALRIIKSREKPLALYVFSRDSAVVERFLSETSSGSACVNDTMFQCSVAELPFGGVGESGMGAYHGRFSFETFSHRKAVLKRTFNPLLETIASFRYPPYSSDKTSRLTLLLKKRKLRFNGIQYLPGALLFLAGMASLCVLQFGADVFGLENSTVTKWLP